MAGKIIDPNGRKPQPKLVEQEIDGKSYPVEALHKAANVTSFVGAMAGQLLNKYLEAHNGQLPINAEARKKVMEACFNQAEEWRVFLKNWEKDRIENYAEAIRASMPIGHDGSRIILADAGMMQDHLPPGSIPHTGR